MQNGIFEIGTLGTLTDFFIIIKEKFLEYTNFELLDSTELSLTFNTKIYDIILKITDTKITDISSTNTSNSLKLEFIKNNISINSISVNYSSSITQDAISSRYINLFVHNNNNNNSMFYAFLNYSANTITTNTMFGNIISKSILDDTQTNRFIIANNFYNSEATNYLTLSNPITNSANGIVMINSMLLNSSVYIDYIPVMYNCSKVTENRYYTINNKKYFSLTSNILIKE